MTWEEQHFSNPVINEFWQLLTDDERAVIRYLHTKANRSDNLNTDFFLSFCELLGIGTDVEYFKEIEAQLDTFETTAEKAEYLVAEERVSVTQN